MGKEYATPSQGQAMARSFFNYGAGVWEGLRPRDFMVAGDRNKIRGQQVRLAEPSSLVLIMSCIPPCEVSTFGDNSSLNLCYVGFEKFFFGKKLYDITFFISCLGSIGQKFRLQTLGAFR